MLRVIGCIVAEHDWRLVVLAACICACASFTTVNLVANAQATRHWLSQAWLLAAAILFGCGTWSLHFVAMLAFMPSLPIGYDVQTTIASAGVVVAGALAALLLWRLIPSRRLGVCVGGIMLGLSVAAMHYCGVAAMQLPGHIRFDQREILLSVIVSIGFATLALARAGTLVSVRRRAEVSGWLSLGVFGLHFTGMTAMSIDLGQPTRQAGAVLGSGTLGIVVGSVSLAILMVSLAATLMEQRLSQRALLELRRMHLLDDLSHEGLIIHGDGIILQVNTAGSRMFGVAADRLAGRRLLDFIPESTDPLVMADADDPAAEPMSGEIHVRAASGHLIPVELSSRRIAYEGRPCIATAVHDLSDRRRHEARIRHLAHHDTLTDLPNRFLLQDRLVQALDTAARTDAPLALLHLDLDHFRQVNDLLGHAGGDALLVQLARRLQVELCSRDTLARIGGDEFVVVATSARPGEVADLAGRLVDAVARPFELQGQTIGIAASIGIALHPGDGVGASSLMHAADRALSRTKQERHGGFHFFDAAVDEHLHARRQLEQDLRHAVERREFELFYQPLLNCRTGDIDGFEALLRWHHPQRGLVPPMEFIPLAEETGLIVKIGQWVIETACEAAAGWNHRHSVAVNVSPVQFRKADLPAILGAALARTGLAGSRLEIEITEGILMEDTTRAVEILSSLRRLGVRVVLDDFGTGYSSLSYLRSFMFDKLKIDKSFVTGLSEQAETTVIVRSIIGLAHSLGISVVAEGVETMQQLNLLQDHLCDQVQGFLLGRPLPLGEFTDLNSARARMLLLGPLQRERGTGMMV